MTWYYWLALAAGYVLCAGAAYALAERDKDFPGDPMPGFVAMLGPLALLAMLGAWIARDTLRAVDPPKKK